MTPAFRAQIHKFRPLERSLRLAARQFGVIARSQAVELGLSASAVGRRVASGAWESMHPGVYRIAGSSSSWEQNAIAATLWHGPGGVLFRRTAAALWELDGSRRGVIELIGVRFPRPGAPFRVHRRTCLEPEEVTRRGPFPVTTLPRTIVDLGSVYDEVRTERFLDAGLRRRPDMLPLVTDCFERLAGRGRDGIATVRSVLEQRDPTLGVPDSVLETTFARMARAFGLPAYRGQFHVLLPSGRNAYIDFAYPDDLLAIEVDGRLTHTQLTDRESDYERAAELVAVGWRIIRFTSRQVRRRPDWVTRQILTALETCGSEPGIRA